MKILHFSDVHGDLEALCKVADFARQRPDIKAVVCSGDLTDANFSPAEAKELAGITAYIFQNIKVEGEDIRSVKQFQAVVDFLNRTGQKQGERYLELEKKFKALSQRTYESIAEIFGQMPQRVLTVPGNWDTQEYFKELAKYDMHKQVVEIDDVEFGGYGGADVCSSCLPITRMIEYDEEGLAGFLEETMPEIAVTHMPPLGINDSPAEKIHTGSPALTKHVSNGDFNLLLHGHCHEDTGIVKARGLRTIVMNPGNLGHYQGSPKNGTFLEVDYNNGQGTSAKAYQIQDNKIVQLMETPVIKGDE